MRGFRRVHNTTTSQNADATGRLALVLGFPIVSILPAVQQLRRREISENFEYELLKNDRETHSVVLGINLTEQNL